MKNGGLLKTRGFADPKYVGDPINAVRIFNEKEVDEIIVADIGATLHGAEPDYGLIRSLAAECRMPMCYAGGVRSADAVERIVELGAEKVAIGTAAVSDPGIIEEAARRQGSQSIVGVIDARTRGQRGYEVCTHSGTKCVISSPAQIAGVFEQAGAGELLVNSIDRDGRQEGYDLQLVRDVWNATTLQVTALGGAGSMQHVRELVGEFGIIGCAAGSLFVFKGKHRAVLINYPPRAERDSWLNLTDKYAPSSLPLSTRSS